MAEVSIVKSLAEQVRQRSCEADLMAIESRQWRARHEPDADMGCRNQAKYVIKGRAYCGKHAGHYALKLLLDIQQAIDVSQEN